MIDINIINKYKRIGVGVSGGLDSMVLLHLLFRAGADLCVVHVNHSIRAESGADQQFVQDFCQRQGIPFCAYVVDAPQFAKTEGISVELAARVLRYRCFEEAAKAQGLDTIALAHHLDDHAETLLLRILRGTGIKGLCGITEREGYIRPLLQVTRSQLAAYAQSNGIQYVDDCTNLCTDYTRNFIRHEVLPKIEKRFGAYRQTLARLAQNAAEVNDLLDGLKTDYILQNGAVLLPKQAFCAHKALAKRSVAACLEALGVMQDIEAVHLDAVLALAAGQVGSRLDLPHDVQAYNEQNHLAFCPKNTSKFAPKPFDAAEEFEFCGCRYTLVPSAEIARGKTFDAAKIPSGAVVRTRQDGDRFCRCKGKDKLLSDYFCQIGYPLRLRDRVLLIADGRDILVILGVEISDRVKVDEGCKTMVTAELVQKNICKQSGVFDEN